MQVFWFLAGVLVTVAAAMLLQWLRSPAPAAGGSRAPWAIGAGAALAVLAGLYFWIGRTPQPVATSGMAAMAGAAAAAGTAAGAPTGAGAVASPGAKAAAGSMNAAIERLEARLMKGGGTPEDWELLAKSYEFLGRPADAAKARAHQLPPVPAEGAPLPAPSLAGAVAAFAAAPGAAAPTAPASATAATSVRGEVMLAPALSARAAAGATLFIVAKSVDSPGPPLAVYRGSVGSWPENFTLDDSQAMLPGRNLSSARRVTIEARISQKGQPLPAPGDLQGTSGEINPADHRAVRIVIDKVIG